MKPAQEQTKEIWRMTWPLFLNGLLFAFAGNLDAFIAGKLGVTEQAAIGIGSQVWFLFAIAGTAVSASCVVLLSKAYGAGDEKLTKGLAKATLLLALLFGLLNVIVALLAAPPLISMQTTSSSVAEKVNAYIGPGLCSLIPFYVATACGAIYLAVGRPLITLINTAVFVVALTVLEPTLCGSFNLGMSGIGYAWLLSQSLSCLTALVIAREFITGTKDQEERLRASFRAIGENLASLVKLGFPLVLQDISWFFSVSLMFCLIASTLSEKSLLDQNSFIESAQAAFAVGLKIDELLMAVFLYALISASRALIGQSLGRGDFIAAKLMVRRLVLIGIAYGCLNALVYCAFAKPIAQFMVAYAPVQYQLMDFLRIIALGQPFLAVFYVLCGCLQAYGRTIDSMVVTVLAFMAVRLPLAWLLAQLWGMSGIWSAMPLSAMAGCLMAYYWSIRCVNRLQGEPNSPV